MCFPSGCTDSRSLDRADFLGSLHPFINHDGAVVGISIARHDRVSLLLDLLGVRTVRMLG